jgi:hypothetical protein
MHKVFCVVLGVGLLFGTIASQDLSVKMPALKKAAQREKPPDEVMDPKLMTAPVKLNETQLISAIRSQLARPVAGITGFLRLDTRTTFVSGKGSLKTFRSSEHDPKAQTVLYNDMGGVKLELLARSGPATYLVDFEFVAIAKDAEFKAYVGDSVATTTVNPGRHHLLYLLDARGGAQVIRVFIQKGFVGFKGVDISIVE